MRVNICTIFQLIVMIDKESPRIATNTMPFLVSLMPHQKAMMYQMVVIENVVKGTSNPYAMMSDKPGAGKTFAVLAFIYFIDKVVFKKHHVNLIVVPYNICSQWKESMLRLFGPSEVVLKYKVITEYSEMMSLYVEPEALLGYDILLTTSLYFDNIAGTINSLNLKLKRVFFDEADTIKGLLKTPLTCPMTWFISASMQSLFGKQDNVSIGNYSLSLQHFTKYDVRCDPAFVNENIILDPPLVNQVKVRTKYYDLLKELLGAHKYLSAMDYRNLRSEFVKDMPIIGCEYEACLYVKKDAAERQKHYYRQKEMLKQDYETMVKKGMDEIASSIYNQIQSCDNNIQECERKLSIFRFFQSKHDINENFDKKPLLYQSKKDALLKTILDIKSTNHRAQILLFTDYDFIYTLLQPLLDIYKNIKYRYLDGGNIGAIDNIISAYKKKEFDILMADSSMYSCGMNLENTTDIIFVHEMDIEREKQVIGRAHRYGREGSLHIHYVNYVM